MYDHQKIELEILGFWKKHKIFDKLRKKNKGNKPWSFIDGPITANNPMGVHHAWGRTYKDVYQRFRAMQGYDQRFQNGFDCQGLWLEVETEKDLGFNSKKDIENYGLAKFSKKCRERVNKFSKIQTQQSIRLGQWMDWDNSYYTMSDTNIEYIWYFLKKCHEKDWLYKDKKVLPWCIRCGTSSSQHEMSDEGYAELTHPCVYVRFKLKGKQNEYFLVWTTTEWTLSSNVALAVNPNLNYVKIKENDDIYYLSEKTLHKLKGPYKILKKIIGKKLIGLKYESIYSNFPVQKKIIHRVIPWKDVGEEEGTGIVHIAPTCGVEDHELAKKEKLLIITSALDEAGNYTEDFGWLTGKNVKEIKQKIIEDLEDRNILYKMEDYTHRYPICWRCKEELVFRMASEWFISCKEIRPIMKREARKVNWFPKHVGKLMQDWLKNMGDWNISRKRYWGLPLMFYECPCGNLEIIGSLKELKNKAVNKKDVDNLPELHRPWIDKINIKCPKCGKSVSRIEEVGDCWLDAGIVPFSTLKYLKDKKYWKKWFPADFETEMRAQIRLWFYSQLFMSVTLENKAPFKNILANEVVKDEHGEDMHKSKGNAIEVDEAIKNMGVDVMRALYTSQNPIYPLRFGYTPAKEVKRSLSVIWNLGNYVKQSCTIFTPQKEKNLDIASKWIVSKRESLKRDVIQFLENLQPHLAIKIIQDYLLNDLSRWYGQLIRNNLNDKKIQTILYNSFLDGLKVLSPFIPFISEKLYQDIYKGKESIFLIEWPRYNPRLINKSLEKNMELTKEIVQKILAKREKIKLGVRWPLKKAVILVTNKIEIEPFLEIIKTQTNIKNLEIKKGKKLSIILDTKLTKELEQEGFAREVMRSIQASRKKAGLNKKDKISLIIDIHYNLENWKKEIKKKVGAKTLVFTTPKKKYKYELKTTVKGKTFKIYFDSTK